MRRYLTAFVLVALAAPAVASANVTITPITPTVTAYPAGSVLPASAANSLSLLGLYFGPGVPDGTAAAALTPTSTVPTGATLLDVQVTTTATGQTYQAPVSCPTGTGWIVGGVGTIGNSGAVVGNQGDATARIRINPSSPAGTYEVLLACLPVLQSQRTVLPKTAKAPVSIGGSNSWGATVSKGQRAPKGWRLVKVTIANVPSGVAGYFTIGCPSGLVGGASSGPSGIELTTWAMNQGPQALGLARTIASAPSPSSTTAYVLCGPGSQLT